MRFNEELLPNVQGVPIFGGGPDLHLTHSSCEDGGIDLIGWANPFKKVIFEGDNLSIACLFLIRELIVFPVNGHVKPQVGEAVGNPLDGLASPGLKAEGVILPYGSNLDISISSSHINKGREAGTYARTLLNLCNHLMLYI